MISTKIFKTIPEQIALLKSRNMKFKNEVNAQHVLRNINYYSLINGYKDLFILPKEDENDEDNFDRNYFEDLHHVYDFDKELSNILFKYILTIEGTFNNALSYVTAENYGYLEKDYLDIKKYNKGEKLDNGLFQNEFTIRKIRRKNASDEQPMKHYRCKHKDVPPWVAYGSLPLTHKKYIFGLLKPMNGTNLKLEIVKWFMAYEDGGNKEVPLKTFNYCLDMVHAFRNEIAHNKRVIQFKADEDQVKSLKKFYFCNYVNEEVYTFKSFRKKIGHRDLFGLFLAITILFTHRNTVRNKFINEVRIVFTDLKSRNIKAYDTILEYNNIPVNFIEIMEGLVTHYNKIEN